MTPEGLLPGFRVGHWTAPDTSTGCTVILPPPGNVASCDVRGSSPSSRELAHLDPERKLTEIHAILLTGASAFGLAAADGVVTWLEEQGIGYATKLAPVPIVPAAVILDRSIATPAMRPGPEAGRAACAAAVESPVARGTVGAGAGATVGKWAGLEYNSPGGIGLGHAGTGAEAVAALAVVNSVGDVVAADGTVVAGSRAPEPRTPFPRPGSDAPSNTVLVVLAVKATLDKRDVKWLAARGSDGIARSVRPAHTRYDGDVVFAIAAPAQGETNLDLLGYHATEAVARAIVDAASHADGSVTGPR